MLDCWVFAQDLMGAGLMDGRHGQLMLRIVPPVVESVEIFCICWFFLFSSASEGQNGTSRQTTRAASKETAAPYYKVLNLHFTWSASNTMSTASQHCRWASWTGKAESRAHSIVPLSHESSPHSRGKVLNQCPPQLARSWTLTQHLILHPAGDFPRSTQNWV